MTQSRWTPAVVPALRHYSWPVFGSDVAAGVTVGLVALPLAMAFAVASGLPPESGIYCAVVTGFLISALGGSQVQIGGPTGALFLVLAGATGLGSAVRFIPRPVVVGFTNGIAVIIASTQIRDYLGLTVAEM